MLTLPSHSILNEKKILDDLNKKESSDAKVNVIISQSLERAFNKIYNNLEGVEEKLKKYEKNERAAEGIDIIREISENVLEIHTEYEENNKEDK